MKLVAHQDVHILDKQLHGFMLSEFGLSGFPDCIELRVGGGLDHGCNKLPMLY